MLFDGYSYEILYEQFRWIYLQGDIKLLLVTVNNRLKFQIEIVHDLSCHPYKWPLVTLARICWHTNLEAYMTYNFKRRIEIEGLIEVTDCVHCIFRMILKDYQQFLLWEHTRHNINGLQ